MGRKKNSTFQGASMFDVDVDALTLRRVMENVAGDLALAADKATGEHGETEVCNHDGTPGRGSLLGVPLINQYVGRRIFFDYSAGGAFSDKDGGGGPTWIFAAPLVIQPGESEVMVAINSGEGPIPTDCNLVCYVRDTAAFAAVGDDRVPLDAAPGDFAGIVGVSTCRIRNLTPGVHLFFVEVDATTMAKDGGDFFFGSITVSPARARRRGAASFPPLLSDSPFGVFVPGAAQGFVPADYDEAAFYDGAPVHGHMTTRLARMINGLYEYVTGWRAGGNAARTLVDHDGFGAPDAVNPSRSRALAHTRSLYANEPEIHWPLWCEGFGPFKPDGGMTVNAASPPTQGMLRWFAPWATTNAATNMRRLRLPVPDFQTASSRLKWILLAGTDSGDVTQWTGRVSAGGATGTAAFAVVPGTNNKLAIATGSALAFTADSEVDVIVGLDRAGAVAGVDECLLLGAALHFDP